MFVRDFIHVEAPFEAVAPPFVRRAGWLEPLATEAVRDALALVPAPDDGPAGAVAVHCRRGTARRRTDALVLPVEWDLDATAPGDASRFPHLDGDVEIAPVGPRRCLVAFSARYDASPTDHLTARVVEAGLRAFLRRLAGRLEDERTG